MQLLEGVGEPAESAPGSRLDGAERDVQEVGDLGLRESAPVSELEQGALVLGQLLHGPMDAPGEPGALRLVRRAGLGRRLIGYLGRRFRPCARPDGSGRPPSGAGGAPGPKRAPARKPPASAPPPGDPPRPSGVWAARRSACSGSTATGPGATPQTRTSGASARAKTRVSIAWAALAAQWAANDGQG